MPVTVIVYFNIFKSFTMKTLQLFSLLIALTITSASFAQSKTEKIPVSGNCDMCKSTIEKSAKKAGAADASWDEATHTLTVTYNSSSSSAAKIQQSIAAAGYDTRDFKAADEAYNKLHDCCKYERAATNKASCCSGDKCAKAEKCCAPGKCEMKDGKCVHAGANNQSCCQQGGTCEKKS